MPQTLQLPQLHIEQLPRDEAEAALLAQLFTLVDQTEPLPDLRNLAPVVRRLFPAPAYQVGCGGAHIWLHRQDDPQRLACIR
ncbi:hypothetical protein [Hymenobacter jeollabukensis]|uniref:Uncharacterized protein n=1 Tax=Hymenobacter jeollabukensis TaxID=2025313 RepID=A0A5R8WHF3_9BACT|nr:hypothetical protein [Hymenobacter jeollabukensis]TLM87294.1 hypothetical protein FDY95_26080 [Hymenobacter jeollabukensis]